MQKTIGPAVKANIRHRGKTNLKKTGNSPIKSQIRKQKEKDKQHRTRMQLHQIQKREHMNHGKQKIQQTDRHKLRHKKIKTGAF